MSDDDERDTARPAPRDVRRTTSRTYVQRNESPAPPALPERRQTGRGVPIARIETTPVEPEPPAFARPQVDPRALAAIEKRLRDELLHEVRSTGASIERNVMAAIPGAVERAVEPLRAQLAGVTTQVGKIDVLIAQSERDRQERIEYRARQEERERMATEQRAAQLHELSVLKERAGIRKTEVEADHVPIEALTRSHAARNVIVVALLALLSSLGTASVMSQCGHRRP